eukprot:GHVU01032953.1.p1 GENE.GHVU01032953.1~~GHVU01032953.1.p1  ORF type:complete len:146 (-),score=1.77 GHVU01032953.1:154-591(-)
MHACMHAAPTRIHSSAHTRADLTWEVRTEILFVCMLCRCEGRRGGPCVRVRARDHGPAGAPFCFRHVCVCVCAFFVIVGLFRHSFHDAIPLTIYLSLYLYIYLPVCAFIGIGLFSSFPPSFPPSCLSPPSSLLLPSASSRAAPTS